MNYPKLGSIARRTGFRPKKNLPKNQNGMEDIDEFFKTDKEDTFFKHRNDSLSDELTHDMPLQPISTIGQSSKILHNVARKIEFNDEETTKSFNLSPINHLHHHHHPRKYSPGDIAATTTTATSKIHKKSPLRSPLSETKSNQERKRGASSALFVQDNSDSFDEGQKQQQQPGPSAVLRPRPLVRPDAEPNRLLSPATIYKESHDARRRQDIDPSPLPSPPPDQARRLKRSMNMRSPRRMNDFRLRNREILPERKRDIYLRKSGIPGSAWLREGCLNMKVKDSNGDLISRNIAFSATAGDFQRVSENQNESCKVAKLFENEDDREGSTTTTTGILEIPFRKTKARHSTGGSLCVFHVMNGLMEITINGMTTFVVNKGCSFEVPCYNEYEIRNIGDRDARLFYVQVRKS